MIVYCTNAQVKYIINTDVDTGDIDNMITLADGELDIMLGGRSMGTNGKAYCSSRLVAIALANRDPETYTVGSQQTNMGSRVRRWQVEVDRRVREAKTQSLRG